MGGVVRTLALEDPEALLRRIELPVAEVQGVVVVEALNAGVLDGLEVQGTCQASQGLKTKVVVTAPRWEAGDRWVGKSGERGKLVRGGGAPRRGGRGS